MGGGGGGVLEILGGIIWFSGGANVGLFVANIVQRGGGYVKLTTNEGGIIGILQSIGASGNFVVTQPTSTLPSPPIGE